MLIFSSELWITIITNVVLISLFIALFFFTYVAYIEGEIVQKQMAFLSEEITSFIKILGPDIRQQIKEYINNMSPINLDDEDKRVKELNRETTTKAIIANIIFLVCCCIGVYFIYNASTKDFSISNVLIKNGIILLFVALTEYGFLTYFGANYISVNPYSIVYNIIEQISKVVN
jgi:hypothetical protein